MWTYLFILLFTVIGGILGYLSHYYLNQFIKILAQQILENFVVFYPQSVLPLPTYKQANFPQYFKPSNFFCIGSFSLIFFSFTLYGMLTNQILGKSIWYSFYFSLLWLIVLFDLRYRLLPIELCYILFLLGLYASHQGIVKLPLSTSLCNALIGFSIFYAISWGAKIIYRKEALGKGDCWLMLGLCSLLPLPQILWLILNACIIGIATILCFPRSSLVKKNLAFSPCLGLSQIFLFINCFLY